MSKKDHWENVYATKDPQNVSWYRPRMEQSLTWIDDRHLEPDEKIVDIGGGASTLVDDLLAHGHTNLAVLDLAGQALEHSQARLGHRASQVQWIVADATTPVFEDQSIAIWHDRAVFHFLDADARTAYIRQVHRCLRPGGFAIIATFGPGGPEKCSGLPVTRYTAAEVAQLLGPSFQLIDQTQENHVTPGGSTQAFTYALCQRRFDVAQR